MDLEGKKIELWEPVDEEMQDLVNEKGINKALLNSMVVYRPFALATNALLYIN